MLTISPVLAGTYDAPDYASSAVNFTSGSSNPMDSASATTTTNAVRKTTDAGEASFSFDDFLDMINPLEHIPLISGIYRAVTGEKINPISHIAGDALYGGVFGLASAAIGAAGAATDSIIESQTGKSGLGTMMAALFGNNDIAVAAADKAPADPTAKDATDTSAVAADASTPGLTTATPDVAVASSTLPAPAAIPAATPSAAALPAIVPAINNPTTATVSNSLVPKTYALANGKLPYGGVMAPTNPLSPMTRQDHAALMSQTLKSQNFGGTLYSNRGNVAALAAATNSAHGTATTQDTAPSTPVPDVSMSQQASGGIQIPPELLRDDPMIMKALHSYSSKAQNGYSAPLGTNLDTVN